MPNEQMPATAAPVSNYSALYLPISIIVAGLLIAGGLYMGLAGKSAATANPGQPAPKVVDVKKVKMDGSPFIGKENAPLTMAYWSDYQCPFCKAVDVGGVQGINLEPSFPTIIKEYVDTGKLKIVFKDYSFLGQDSITGAEYGRAVWALYPDKYYTWREAMFKAQDAEGDQGFGDAASIDALITKLGGFNLANIKADIVTNKAKYDAAIQADQKEGASYGIQGTPGFIIGKQSIDGAVPLAQFQAAIDSQLK